MQEPVIHPPVPYVGELSNGLVPGRMVKIQGKVPPNAVRFAVNYQLGPTLNPRDDVALHIAPRFTEGFITRNHIQSMTWGPEENLGQLRIQPGTAFEIIVLCEYENYKIAINGHHFADFRHRLPYQKVTHLVIDGDVEIDSIFWEDIPLGPPPNSPAPLPNVNVGPPVPGGIYPTIDMNQPPPFQGYRPTSPTPLQDNRGEEDDQFTQTMDKIGLALGGLAAAGGVAAALHAYNKSKEDQPGEPENEKSQASRSESGFGGLGLGSILGSVLASSIAENIHANKGYPPQPQGSGGFLGSIIGAMGNSSQPGQQRSGGGDPLAALGSLFGGGGSGRGGQDPFGGALGSLLGNKGAGGSMLDSFLGGGRQQPQYQPSGGYGGYNQPGRHMPQNQNDGNDLLSDLFKSAMGGLSKNKSHDRDDQHHSTPQPNYGPPPHEPRPSHNEPASGGGKLSASEISKGLGLGDDDD